jgi:hypothetical protein
LCMEAVGIWMIHTRQPKTRQFLLVWIPIHLVLMPLRHHLRTAMGAATAGHTLGSALSAVLQQPQPYYYIIWFALTSVSWLYWFRSERVKQTFAPMSPAAVESTPHSELADTPQSSTVIRVFLVDVVLLALILWPLGIRSGILDFSMPLRVLLPILWVGAIGGAFIYGTWLSRGYGVAMRKFSAGGVGLSLGIPIILMLLFGSIIPAAVYTCTAVGISLAISRFGIPRWEDKLSVALTVMHALFGVGLGMTWQGVVGEVTPTRASYHTHYALPAYQRADTLPSLFSPNENKKAQAASESTMKK